MKFLRTYLNDHGESQIVLEYEGSVYLLHAGDSDNWLLETYMGRLVTTFDSEHNLDYVALETAIDRWLKTQAKKTADREADAPTLLWEQRHDAAPSSGARSKYEAAYVNPTLRVSVSVDHFYPNQSFGTVDTFGTDGWTNLSQLIPEQIGSIDDAKAELLRRAMLFDATK